MGAEGVRSGGVNVRRVALAARFVVSVPRSIRNESKRA